MGHPGDAMVPAYGMVFLPHNPSTDDGQIPGCSFILSMASNTYARVSYCRVSGWSIQRYWIPRMHQCWVRPIQLQCFTYLYYSHSRTLLIPVLGIVREPLRLYMERFYFSAFAKIRGQPDRSGGSPRNAQLALEAWLGGRGSHLRARQLPSLRNQPG